MFVHIACKSSHMYRYHAGSGAAREPRFMASLLMPKYRLKPSIYVITLNLGNVATALDSFSANDKLMNEYLHPQCDEHWKQRPPKGGRFAFAAYPTQHFI